MYHYEINVSLNGIHLFATHKRSVQTEKQLKKIYAIFKEKFPKSEGYNITIIRYSNIGIVLEEKDLEG